MLYDPKWEKQDTKADPLSLGGLIAWLEKQPERGRYDFHDCRGACLLDRYLRSIGAPETAGNHIRACGSGKNYSGVAGTRPYTFGAALKRARAIHSAGQ